MSYCCNDGEYSEEFTEELFNTQSEVYALRAEIEELNTQIFELSESLYNTRDRVRELEAAMTSMRDLFESRGQHAAGDMVNIISRAMDK